jgi:indolepyruvate ferredoxin oxidoreductase beta subunit
MPVNVVLVGTGGQGIILAARIVAETAMSMGFDVKTSEVHGMAQRGGSVISMVRWGEKVYSPLIPRGHAEFMLGFEGLEALRYLDYLGPKGKVILNDYRLDPLPVLKGDAEYPADYVEMISRLHPDAIILQAKNIAKEAGNVRVVSTVMIGALSTLLDFPEDLWEETIRNWVPQRALEANLGGFRLGRKFAER